MRGRGAGYKKIDPPTPGGSIVCFYFVTGYQFGLIQQKALLAGGKAAVAGQKLALIVLGRGLVAKQIVDADPKIIRNAPQGVIVRLAGALHDSRHSSEGTRRAKGRARAVAPMQRLVIVLDCLENRKNYGAMAQKYAVAYHQVYRWVQRYLQDGWLGMNDRRGPADDPGPEGEWARVAPANEDAAEKWVARCAGVPDALPALLRRAGYSWSVIAKILFDLARM